MTIQILTIQIYKKRLRGNILKSNMCFKKNAHEGLNNKNMRVKNKSKYLETQKTINY